MLKWYILSGFFVFTSVGVVANISEQGASSNGFKGLAIALALAALFFWLGRRAARKKSGGARVKPSIPVRANVAAPASPSPETMEEKAPAANTDVMFFSSNLRGTGDDAEQTALFKEVFYNTMGTIQGFTRQEIDKLHAMLTGQESGPGETAVRYSQEAILEAGFVNREWSWPELEEWESVFVREGRFPDGWHGWWSAKDMNELDLPDLCDRLKVEDLKDVLNALGIAFPSKAKKADLVALLTERATVVDIARAMPGWENMRRQRNREKSKARGRALFDVIGKRAGSLHLKKVLASRGRKPALVIDVPSDEPYIQRVLAINPNAVPPFFPGDRSRYSL